MHNYRILRALAPVSSVGVLAAAFTFAMAPGASADMINIVSEVSASTEGISSFTGTIDYGFNAISAEWQLTVTLVNTSDPANGGYITGFIFNIDSADSGASASLISATYPFLNAPNQSGSPFGEPYNSGAALGGEWLGGGTPENGIAVGDMGSFTFSVSASDAASLTAISFMNGPFEYDFVVRFRGFDDGDSDKVPAVVPAPSVLTVMVLALLSPRRRRN